MAHSAWVSLPAPTAYQQCTLNGPLASATVATFTPDGKHTIDFAIHSGVYAY